MIDYLCAEECRFCSRLIDWRDDGPYTVCFDCWSTIKQRVKRTELVDGFQCFSAVEYETPVITRLVRELKYRGDELVSHDFAKLIEPLWSECSSKFGAPPYVVAVPLHWSREFIRGFNQSGLVAEELASRVGASCEPSLLKRVRRTKAHHGLTKGERALNVRGAFVAQPAKSRSAGVVLVDDVLTSGATMMACAQALQHAGFGRVVGLTVARAQLEREKNHAIVT